METYDANKNRYIHEHALYVLQTSPSDRYRGQKKLLKSKVAVIGAGALGSWGTIFSVS